MQVVHRGMIKVTCAENFQTFVGLVWSPNILDWQLVIRLTSQEQHGDTGENRHRVVISEIS